LKSLAGKASKLNASYFESEKLLNKFEKLLNTKGEKLMVEITSEDVALLLSFRVHSMSVINMLKHSLGESFPSMRALKEI
jgi:hypothetical protein